MLNPSHVYIIYSLLDYYYLAGCKQAGEIGRGTDDEGRGHPEAGQDDLVLRAHHGRDILFHAHSQEVDTSTFLEL